MRWYVADSDSMYDGWYIGTSPKSIIEYNFETDETIAEVWRKQDAETIKDLLNGHEASTIANVKAAAKNDDISVIDNGDGSYSVYLFDELVYSGYAEGTNV